MVRTLSSAAVLLCLGVLVGCVDGDTGLNPPPARSVRVIPTAAARPATPPTAPPAPPTVPGPTAPQATAPRPAERPDAPGEAAPLGREAVAIHLLDRLGEATITSPHLEGDEPVVRQGKRAYTNPWTQGPNAALDQRTVWSDGARAEFALRAALTLPAPATARWTLDVPAHATVRFGAAVGSRVAGEDSARLELALIDGERRQVVWHQEQPATPIHKLKRWHEVAVPLPAAGRVTLELSAHHDARGHQLTAFLAEPVVTTRAPDAAPAQGALGDAPNVLLIVIDAMRGDLVGPAREARGLPELFPAVERLGREGAFATQAFSVGNQTRLSTFAFLSAQYPTYARYHHRRWNYSEAEKRRFYDARPPLLPILLRQLGYRTVGVANNLFLFGNLELSLDGGFDRFIDHRHGTRDTAWITETAQAWITENADQRWFMMVNYNGPHTPYQPPEDSYQALLPKLEGVEGFSKPYLGEVRWSDDNVAQLLATLDQLKLTEDTLVIVTSDHGEVMDPEHECYNKNWDSNCLHNHGKTLFDEEIHVPFVVRLPGRIPAGTRVDTPVSHIDLGPTVVGLAGALPAPSQLGRDLSAVFTGGPAPEAAPILVEARLATALRHDGFKYIVHDRRELMTFERKTLFNRAKSLEELYDLSADPRELDNLVLKGDHPRLQAMRDLLQRMREDLATRRGEAPPEPLAVAAPQESDSDADADPIAPEPADSRPTSADPPADAAEAWTDLRCQGPAHVTGRITAAGRVVAVLPAAGAPTGETPGARIDADGRLHLDLRGSGRGVRFRTEPPGAALTLELRLDDQPLSPAQLYVGPWGLHLFRSCELSSEELALAHAPRGGPSIAPDAEPGLFLWRTGDGVTATIERADELDGEVRDMMKAWGYTGK